VPLLERRRSRSGSSGTAETMRIYHYPLPNQYSHNPWYKKRGQATVQTSHREGKAVSRPTMLVRLTKQANSAMMNGE